MASPVNIGDAIAILAQIYHIYDAYKNTPDKLCQALRKFEDAERECKALNRILATSRRPEYRTYPGSPDLVKDLAKARDFFERFEPLTDSSGKKVQMTARVKKTFSAKWSWSQVENHVATIEMHRDNMKNFKQDVLIQAAYDNMTLQIHGIRLQLGGKESTSGMGQATIQDETSSFSSDRISVLSRASHSLKLARQLERGPSKNRQLQLSPIIEASSTSTRPDAGDVAGDLKQNVADLVEKAELHKPDHLQLATSEDLERLAKLPARWLKLQQGLTQQSSGQLSSSRVANGRGVLDTISIHSVSHSNRSSTYVPIANDDAFSISPSWRNAFARVQYGQNEPSLSSISERLLPDAAIDTELDATTISDNYSICSTTAEQDQSFIVDEVMIITPWHTRPLPCQLKMIPSEGSLCIQSSTIKKFHANALPPMGGSVAVTPSSLLHMSDTSDEIRPAEQVPLVFNHAVLCGMSSFPKVLHPSAEMTSPGTDSYPYIVEFYQHQYMQVDRYEKLQRAVKGLAYLFRHKEDRDAVRQKIFGRQLLASVGISTIEFDTASPKPCGTQAASLWKRFPSVTEQQDSDPACHPNELTITIQCSTKGKRTEPDCAKEFIVLNIRSKNVDKIKYSAGKELELDLQLIEREDLESPTTDMSGGILSSDASNISGISERSQSHSLDDPIQSPKIGSRKQSFFSKSRTLSIVSAVTTKPSNSLRCYLKFTEGSPSLDKAKERFLDALQTNLERKG